MIGEIIQHILKRNFYLEYSYSDMQEGVHRFKVWRLYKGNPYQVSFAISDIEVRYAREVVLIEVVNNYLARITNAITQQQLIKMELP